MKKSKCPFCNHKVVEKEFSFTSGKKDPITQENIVIPNAKAFCCTNCNESWFSESHQEFINLYIQKKLFTPLGPKDIALIRESLPFKTKKQLADFLCLNDKAFVKWEKSYSAPNPAYDILLRLVAYSEENFKFIKHLHSINFKFNPADYHYTKNITTSKNITFHTSCEPCVDTLSKFDFHPYNQNINPNRYTNVDHGTLVPGFMTDVPIFGKAA